MSKKACEIGAIGSIITLFDAFCISVKLHGSVWLETKALDNKQNQRPLSQTSIKFRPS